MYFKGELIMSDRTYIRQAMRDSALQGTKVQVMGWIRTNRTGKNVCFIELNDGTTLKGMQLVYNADLANFDAVSKLITGSSISATGSLDASQGKGQSVELQVESLEILGECDPSFPLQKKRHSFEYLRNIAHLRPRTNTYGAVFRVRSRLAFAVNQFFVDRGFVCVHTPIITGSDCEGAGEMFRVTTLDPQNAASTEEGGVDWSKDFFARQTNLTVSGQLSAEMFALALSDVYTFGPTFRAENSNTTRHACEFWMIEPEIAFADLAADCRLAQDFVQYVIKDVLEHCEEDIAFFSQWVSKGLKERLEHVANTDFVTVSYTEAIDLLAASGEKFDYLPKWGVDLQTEHERWLTEKHFKKPVFVIDYPRDIKPFYMRQNEDGKTVAAMDLLVPSVGELIGGSQREERLDKLTKRLEEMGLPEEDYAWYLDSRRFGSVKHAGFGLGFERLVMYVTGMENIRDVIPFPRTPKSCNF
jgi:asparaginyl-tRNA synthetase